MIEKATENVKVTFSVKRKLIVLQGVFQQKLKRKVTFNEVIERMLQR